MTIEELRSLMCIPCDASKDDITSAFKSIGNALMNDFVITYAGVDYRILDFEFYFYNKYHQDISVHPRESEALCWYINDFGGIDLNFKSEIKKVEVIKDNKISYKYALTDESFFGGILIRQIQRLSDKVVFDGPLKVAELFRTFDATSPNQSNPILKQADQLEDLHFKITTRHNLLGSHKNDPKRKADYNLNECFTPVPDILKQRLGKELERFNDSLYHYCYQA